MSAIEFVGKAVKGAAKLLRGSKGTAKEAAEGMVKITGESAKEVASLTKGAASGSTKVVASSTKGVLDASGGMAKSSAKMASHEVAAVKEAYASRAIKSIGNPSYKAGGVEMPNRFTYRGGMFFDAKRSRIFNIQEFGRFQSHYRNLYGSARSGYLSFEKSLPKPQWFGFNKSIPKLGESVKPIQPAAGKVAGTVGKETRHAYVKPTVNVTVKESPKIAGDAKVVDMTGKTVKTTGKAANSAGKVEEGAAKTAEELAKQAESTAANAGKEATKRNYGGWDKLLTYEEQKKIAGGALKHWLPLLLGGIYLKSKIEDKSVLSTAVGEITNGHGLVDDLGLATLGQDKYDALSKELGRLYDKGANGVSFVGNELSDAYGASKDMVGKVFNEFGDGYDFFKNKVVNYNGMVNDGNGQYQDPSVQQYQALQEYLEQNPEAQQMLQQNPQLANALLQSQSGGGSAAQLAGNMASGAVTGINSLLGNFTGGNVQKMDLASLMLSGLLFFGRFGMLGKVASAVMAGMTMKKMNARNNGQSVMQEQQGNGYNMQALNALLKQNTLGQTQPVPAVQADETPVVHRGARL